MTAEMTSVRFPHKLEGRVIKSSRFRCFEIYSN